MGKKPKDMPPPQESETPFQRFAHLVGKLVSAPKKGIDQREVEWKKQRKADKDNG